MGGHSQSQEREQEPAQGLHTGRGQQEGHRKMKGGTKEARHLLSKVLLGTEGRPGFKFCLCLSLQTQEAHEQN